jgi:hypothetical protein
MRTTPSKRPSARNTGVATENTARWASAAISGSENTTVPAGKPSACWYHSRPATFSVFWAFVPPIQIPEPS